MFFILLFCFAGQVWLLAKYPVEKRKRAWHGFYGTLTILMGIAFLVSGLITGDYLTAGLSTILFGLGINSFVTASKFK